MVPESMLVKEPQPEAQDAAGAEQARRMAAPRAR
jgi:hypothetical protein